MTAADRASEPDTRAELDQLIVSANEGELTHQQIARLKELLDSDEEAGLYYVAVMYVQAGLWRYFGNNSVSPRPACCDLADTDAECRDFGSAAPPPLISLGNSVQGMTGYFASGWPVAYLAATVIFGIGLLIGSHVYVSQPVQIARQSVLPSTSGRGAGGEGSENVTHSRPTVGRITGMVDCKWETRSGFRVQGSEPVVSGPWSVASGQKQSELRSSSHQPPATSHLVSHGDEFALVSGLMEITYDTGAKVILQGPATYEVESRNGGYLSVGKLTARVENAKPQAATSKSPNLQISKLFVVRTPTAIVTDLGTEFGVTVSREGRTEVHVLQGVVETQATTVGGASPRTRRITEGLAVAIGPKTKGVTSVAFAPQSFVRNVRVPMADTPTEAAYIQAVLADKPMGYWPLNEPAGSRTFHDRSGKGIHGYGMNKVMAGQVGPLADGSRAVALSGHEYIDFGYRPEFSMKNDFTVEAWLWIGKVEWSSYVISALGRDGKRHIGWGLIAGRKHPGPTSDAENPLVLDFIKYGAGEYYFSLPGGESIQQRWLHVAVVFDRANTAHLYLNGKHRGSVATGQAAQVGPLWLEIGTAELVDADFWRGRLAHVAVYPRALSPEQIQNHYAQRDGGKEAPDKQPR